MRITTNLICLLSVLWTSAQKQLPVKLFHETSKNSSYMLEQNKVTNIVTLEAKELPLLIQSLKFYKGFLEITATTCLARNPDCMPLGELRVFTAKKRNNYLSDTATLYYKINTIEYFPKDTVSSEYKAFYNQIFEIVIDLKKDEFIYFFSEGYCLIELNVKWLFQKIKKKYY